MNDNIKKLMDELEFNIETATAYAETSGKCIYCNIDIINDFSMYIISQIDHIFPKSKYPDVQNDPKNNVLSCYYCNQKKRNYIPENLTDTPEIILYDNKKRMYLIEDIRKKCGLSIKNTHERIKNEKEYLDKITKILK